MVKRGYKIYSYKGGNVWTCEVGIFKQYKDIRELLQIPSSDLFFFPPTVAIPLPGEAKAKIITDKQPNGPS